MALMDFMALLMVALSFSLSHYRVEGGRSISKEEDLDLERQLKSLNKPPIKTIQTEEGEIIDCVDIYKQPALDHPLLKDHKIQMRPTSLPKELSDETSSVDQYSKSTLRSIDCPEGTVPIPRTRKEDLIRAKSFSNSYSTANIHPLTTEFPGLHYAIMRTKKGTKMTYKGLDGRINVYNPQVETGQRSAAQMWIENGPHDEHNSLQAGWMVAPGLFVDNRTRLFIYWTVDGGNKTGCFNLLCHGFVETTPTHHIGGLILPVSKQFGTQYFIKLLIFQDVTGHWWLTIADGDTGKDINLGYWPKELLPQLVGGASYVAWGGLTKGTSREKNPPMGNGNLPNNLYFKPSFIKRIHIVNAANDLVNPEALEKYVDFTLCYNVQDYGYQDWGGWGHVLLFGGPGGKCAD